MRYIKHMQNGDRDSRNGEYRTLTAEHADGWHDASPHARCSECRRESKDRKCGGCNGRGRTGRGFGDMVCGFCDGLGYHPGKRS